MDNPFSLETQRLILRTFTQADLENLYCQLSDSDVMRYYPSALSREESEKWLEGILWDYKSTGYGMLGAYLKVSEDYVGQVGIMRRLVQGSEHHFLSYLIQKEFWQQGYATEAVRGILEFGFRMLGIQKVEALIRPVNTRSVRFAMKLGMFRESCIEHQGYEHYVYTRASEQFMESR